MAWDWKHTIFAGLAVVGIAGGGIAFHCWKSTHDALLGAESTVQQQQKVLNQDAQAARQIAAQVKQRDAQTARRIATLRARAAQETTPSQIAAWLPKQILTPQPIHIQLPKPTRKNPAPAAVATIPQPDLAPLRDFVTACQACSIRLHSAQQDLAAKDAQLKLAGERLSAALKQRDAALQAARGGGFWRRMGTAVKWFAIGAGTGAALLCGSGHCQ
ncbi:MAG TPA: hypothetical protein VNJ52_13590 [Patescibacteria group bacterium]|nr:hypothetical protein [Patescibacteria group bacterium]